MGSLHQCNLLSVICDPNVYGKRGTAVMDRRQLLTRGVVGATVFAAGATSAVSLPAMAHPDDVTNAPNRKTVTDKSTINWFGPFGGSWVSSYHGETILDSTHSGSRANQTIKMVSSGTGENGPDRGDYALFVSSEKEGVGLGEIDGISTAIKQSALGDCSAYLANVKKVPHSDHGATCFEGKLTNINSSDTATLKQIKVTMGRSVGAASLALGSDGTIGFQAKALVGELDHAFACIGDSNSPLVNILTATYGGERDAAGNDPIMFQISTGADRISPMISMGKPTNRVSLRWLNSASLFQVLNSDSTSSYLNLHTNTAGSQFWEFKTDVKIAPGKDLWLGQYESGVGTITGHLKVRDANGNVRKLAVIA